MNNKLARASLLISLALILSFSFIWPAVVSASSYFQITITAYGYDFGAPTNFVITETSPTEDNITWTPYPYAGAITVIARKTGSYPTSPTDGFLVYSDNGSYVTDNSLELDNHIYYYRAWTQVGPLYSSDYAQGTIGSEGGLMQNVILLGIFGFFGSASLAGAWWMKRWPLAIIAAVAWLACAIGSFALAPTPSNYLDMYHIFGYFSVLILFACVYEPVYEAGHHLDIDEQNMSVSERRIYQREKRIYGRLNTNQSSQANQNSQPNQRNRPERY